MIERAVIISKSPVLNALNCTKSDRIQKLGELPKRAAVSTRIRLRKISTTY